MILRVCFAFWLIHCSLVSHAGKGWPLGSLERDVIFFVFLSLSPCRVLSQVVCLIVQIPDFCLVTY